ncbi:MAG: sugar transferase [Chitinophagaceae bacterium]|nr:sugar transferase [Chitinophagaceae bacterium]
MYKITKRIFDIVFAGICLVILSPLFLVIIMILKFTGEHEIFFRQKRIGYMGEPFMILKFATMLKNSPNMGTKEITLRNDPRVTKVGRYLRITKLNELPQIINVILGDMSIVGPRPLMEISYKLYAPEVAKIIYSSRPGITGIGSIYFRDEEKIVSQAKDPKAAYRAIFKYKAKLELWYKKNASWPTDIKIILLTALALVISDKNIAEKLFSNLPSKTEDARPEVKEHLLEPVFAENTN